MVISWSSSKSPFSYPQPECGRWLLRIAFHILLLSLELSIGTFEMCYVSKGLEIGCELLEEAVRKTQQRWRLEDLVKASTGKSGEEKLSDENM
jgi:hypothetical protein